MHDLYGPNLAPHSLKELTGQLIQWKSNLRDSGVTRRIAELWNPIGKIDGSEQPEVLSFSSILEKHRQDETLQKCLEELINSLEKLLAEGDETLSSQAAKELERVLQELKKRKNQSLFDIQPWIEFALVSTAAVVDQFTETPLATIAAAAVIAAKESQLRVDELFCQARNEYIESLKLKGKVKWEGIFGQRLKEAKIEEIRNALENSEGIKCLTDNPGRTALPPSSKEKA